MPSALGAAGFALAVLWVAALALPSATRARAEPVVTAGDRMPPGLSAAERRRALATGRVSEQVVEALRGAGRVAVIVQLADEGAAGAEPGGAGRAPWTLRERQARVLARLQADDLVLGHRYQVLPGLAGRASGPGLLRLLDSPEVLRIDVDGGGRGHLGQAVPLANLDATRALGWSGDGVTVAILDSGFDAAHPDLAGAVVGEACFCGGGGGCCPGGGATRFGSGAAQDDHGHGTNVTGIVTSDGAIAPEGGAPDASIVAVKVLDSNNAFQFTSDVIAGLDWILAQRPDVDVVNMSLGTFATYTGACDGADAATALFSAAIGALHAREVITTVASLNGGSLTHMSAPACIGKAMSVGAVWDASLGVRSAFGCSDATAPDLMTCWSNRNAETDLFAPGALTTSTGLGGGSSTFQGTSQAAPLVAACLAALLEMDPGLRAQQLELALRASPTRITDPLTGLDYPRLDCEAALRLAQGLDVPLPPWSAPLLAAALLAAARRGLRPRPSLA